MDYTAGLRRHRRPLSLDRAETVITLPLLILGVTTHASRHPRLPL